jgi:hypothetical protein
VGSYPIVLNFKGVFQLDSNQYNTEINNKKKISTLNLSNTLCLVSRDCYWEHVVSYPTSNPIEVKNIIASEIITISPVSGETVAFIIRIANKKTIVLYCCFSDELLARAKEFNLWRLIPESLPLYRELCNKNGSYAVSSSISPLLYFCAEENDKNKQDHLKKTIVIKVNGDQFASLPLFFDNGNLHSELLFQESEGIGTQEYLRILKSYKPLNTFDHIIQIFHFISKFLSTNRSVFPYFYMFFIGLISSYFLGKSMWLLWTHEHLTQTITSNKSDASQVIKRSNSLKKIIEDITKINKTLNEHIPKTPMFKKLKEIIIAEETTEFDVITINPTEVQLIGVTESSTSLLSLLSKAPGVTKVEFSIPPVTIKGKGERFNIHMVYESVFYTNSFIELQ